MKKILKTLKNHKLVVMLSLVLLLVAGTMALDKYDDWDNAQMIKGLARDFPVLIEEIEKETGLELDIKNNCATTQEKFSAGVKTCELGVTGKGNDKLEQNVRDTVTKSSNFVAVKDFEHNPGFSFEHRDGSYCDVGFGSRDQHQTFGLSCIVGVRDPNVDLAREAFGGIR